ncbi:MmgE/PrpD family protein [Falsiruegeria litorea R37]|uniref:MmgE/PrpD family protein n=1 Tax=Falsiruegeria litorea R37 TaxID=1200284 RepID=A0A1Y5SMV0_9RHOB|nr:MmgE/PrpD family protein [Falsiruegeria litorea]SLN44368.1 MmgE/PrpD family protein [Falsiruegeria litorea R37]
MPTFDRFAADLTYADLPAPVLQVLRRSFLDTMGVAAVGSTTPLASIARKGATALFGVSDAGPARMMMDGTPVSPAGAAMAGAFTIDSIDAHDGTSPCKGHAGSAIFPALMAVADAQVQPATGADFATLLAIAYEVSYRAGLAQHATCADYHTSGAWTAVGVAAAVARQLGAGAEIIRHAAGIGEYHGPRSQMMRCIDHPTMVRDGVGWGAPSGVTAAYLATMGFTGAPALTCEGDDAAAFWSDLGDRWQLVEDTHYKPYPCCRWAHPALDAAAELMSAHNLIHNQVAEVEIRTFHNATRLAGHEPATPDEFAYSIAFPVATQIVRGQVGVPELAPETLTDPDILRLSRATTLIDDPHFTKISVGKRWAQVTLVLQDGTRLTSEPRTPRGDTDLPLSDREISDKFHLFADPVLGRTRADEIEDLSTRFDSLSAQEVSRLLDLCLNAPG